MPTSQSENCASAACQRDEGCQDQQLLHSSLSLAGRDSHPPSKCVAKEMPADTIAPVVREYESEIAKIEVTLAQPRPVTVDKVRLRAALEQRTKEWRDTLRATRRARGRRTRLPEERGWHRAGEYRRGGHSMGSGH